MGSVTDPHPYATCHDRACDWYGCIAYRHGREDAYEDGSGMHVNVTAG